MEESRVLTISGLVTFLSQIEQLRDFDIQVTEEDDKWCISIGDDVYCLESPEESLVVVDDEVIDSVEEIDEEGWDEISYLIEEDEPVEGGIIKELIKTLAIGGLVRLTKKALETS